MNNSLLLEQVDLKLDDKIIEPITTCRNLAISFGGVHPMQFCILMHRPGLIFIRQSKPARSVYIWNGSSSDEAIFSITQKFQYDSIIYWTPWPD